MAKKKVVNENELSVQVEESSSSSAEEIKAKPKAKAKTNAKTKVVNNDNNDDNNNNVVAEAKAKAKAKAKEETNSDADKSDNESNSSESASESESESEVETKKTSSSSAKNNKVLSAENKKILKNISNDFNNIAKHLKVIYMKNIEDDFDIKKTKNVFKIDAYLFLYSLYLVKNNNAELPSCIKDNKEVFDNMYAVYETLGKTVMKQHLYSETDMAQYVENNNKLSNISDHFILGVMYVYMLYLAHNEKHNVIFQLKKLIELSENAVKQLALTDKSLVQYIKNNPFANLKKMDKFNKFEQFHL